MQETYEEWEKRLDAYVARHLGVGIYDLPDQPYRDYYEDEIPFEDILELLEEDLDR